MKTIEDAFKHKDLVVGAFLDIEGDFNNVLPEAIIGSLNRLRVEADLGRLIHHLLRDRTVLVE